MRSREARFPGSLGVDLSARLELPDDEPKAVGLFAHCFTCSKDVVAASRISKALADRGVAVLRFDFTGLGSSDGDFANTDFSSNVADLRYAAAWLEAELGAVSLLVGHSLGGAAVLAAARHLPTVRAVITIGAPSDVTHIEHLFEGSIDEIETEGVATVNLAGRPFQIRKDFLDDLRETTLDQCAGGLGRPLLIMHSPTDDTVSIDHAAAIYGNARHPKSFISIDGADHLLTDLADAKWVAHLIAGWADRYHGG
jgi:putative redox protein